MAVTAMPMILLPLILFSRVAYGHGSNLASKPPFGTIGNFPAENFLDQLVYLISFGFITRPCAMTMALCFDVNVSTGVKVLEWFYLALLLVLYASATVIGFVELQKRWNDWR